jgi:hypothetical protein
MLPLRKIEEVSIRLALAVGGITARSSLLLTKVQAAPIIRTSFLEMERLGASSTLIPIE